MVKRKSHRGALLIFVAVAVVAAMSAYLLVPRPAGAQSGLVPVFTKSEYHFSIGENMPAGTLLGTVSATSGLRHTYTMSANSLFNINSKTGDITAGRKVQKGGVPRELTVTAGVIGYPHSSVKVYVEFRPNQSPVADQANPPDRCH